MGSCTHGYILKLWSQLLNIHNHAYFYAQKYYRPQISLTLQNQIQHSASFSGLENGGDTKRAWSNSIMTVVMKKKLTTFKWKKLLKKASD